MNHTKNRCFKIILLTNHMTHVIQIVVAGMSEILDANAGTTRDFAGKMMIAITTEPNGSAEKMW
jgi:hypothetical protein